MLFELILRWMHILGAVTLVGGTYFACCAFSHETDPAVQAHQGAVRRRWSKLVAASVGLLLLSGLVNIGRIVTQYEILDTSLAGSAYHALFGIKFLLALAVFFLASALSGKSGMAERLRRQEKRWLTINAVLATLVVLLAGVMKLADRVPKEPELPQVQVSGSGVELSHFYGHADELA